MRYKIIKQIVLVALFSVIITICSWITIPSPIPFTLQIFAIYVTTYLLGPKYSLCSILLYFTLGMIGIPVFANFNSGISAILGPTGGYLIGFIFVPIIYFLFGLLIKNDFLKKIISSIVSLVIIYLFGSIWFMLVYTKSINFIDTILLCVIPFIIPDLIKISLAIFIDNRFKKLNSFKNLY